MLTIDQATFDAVVAHARAEHPRAACGLVVGPVGADRPGRVIPMVNTADSAVHWSFDPVEHLRVYRELDAEDEEPVVVYRSYPTAAAYPGEMDVRHADPDVHHVIISTRDPEHVELRSFRIEDGVVAEEIVHVVPTPPGRPRSRR